MYRKKFFLLGALMVLVSISLISSRSTEAKELQLWIGTYIPLSGPGSDWGIQTQRGMEMARDDINSAGGLTVGGEKYLIKTVAYDHKFTSAGALEAVNRLIFEDKVKFIGMSIGTAPMLAGLSVTEPNRVINLGTCTSDAVLGPDKPYSFRINIGGREYTMLLYRWLRKKYPEAKTVAFLSRDDVFGRDLEKFGRNAIQTIGLTAVHSDYFKGGTSDFSPWLTKIINLNPDILDSTGTIPGEGGAIIKIARQLGYKGIIITSVSSSPDTILKIATPEYAEGAISVLSLVWDPEDKNLAPKQREFAKRYIGKFKEPLPMIAVQAYDTIMIITTAIRNANSFDTTVVKSVMAESKYSLLQGEASFGGEKTYGIRRQIVVPCPIIQCVGGRFVLMGAETP